MSALNQEIFREYDIRGTVGSDLTPATVRLLGASLGAYFGRHGADSVVVGRDVRPSSGWIQEVLTASLLASGLDVVDAGECPTPVLYHASIQLESPAAVMITGSHNPPQFNGLKLVLRQDPVFGEAIREIARISEFDCGSPGKGARRSYQACAPYLADLRQRFSLSRPVKVVVDCGNGTAGPVAIPLYRQLGGQVIPLFDQPDGTFPAHHPDPTVDANLLQLAEKVRAEGADLGIGFDGDADRLGAVDENGRPVRADLLMLVFARQILERQPGSKIIADVKCSRRLFEAVERYGGIPLMWKTGHSLTRAKVKEEGAPLGGELSGHFCFADRYYGYDDGIYAGARLLEVCADTGSKLSGLLKGIDPVFSTEEIRRECPESLKFRVVEGLRRRLEGRFSLVTLDGVRLEFEDGWGLVRASNTQPILVLRFEAATEKRLGEIRGIVEAEVRASLQEAEIAERESKCTMS